MTSEVKYETHAELSQKRAGCFSAFKYEVYLLVNSIENLVNTLQEARPFPVTKKERLRT